MRVLSLPFAAIFALFAVVTTQAEAGWRDGIFGDNLASKGRSITKRTAAPRPRAAKPRSATKRRAQTRVRTTRNRARTKPSRSTRTKGTLRGLASFYWQPQRVASGGWFNPNALTAAHKTLRFGTRVRVTNLRNGRSVVVRINDRGPYIRGRIIDLSRRAATIVGMRGAGVVPVKVDIL